MLTRSNHKAHPGRGYNGPLPKRVWHIVKLAWENGIALQSNLAREASSEIALAASMGWISSVSLDGKHYLRHWNVTSEGTVAYDNRELHR